jgi:Kef-type K+ transport system membrane component KefB
VLVGEKSIPRKGFYRMFTELMREPVGIFLVIMGVVLIAPIISNSLKLPEVVGLIGGGFLIGPYGLAILERNETITALATVGVIYLMFSAGAEVDLAQFSRVRRKSLVYGVITFIFPQGLGILLGLALGYNFASSILLGSLFASHTLIAFPILTQLGLVKNEAVAVTIGATIVTNILALLILAGVAQTATGDVSALFLLQLVILLIIYSLIILIIVPRIGRWFFRRFAGGISLEVQFVLLVIFLAAFFAEAIGMEAIVGAFLAGFAVNATLPRHSLAMTRVLFIGESFFIPIFLLNIGMLLNVGIFFTDGRALLIGAGMVVAVYVTKYIAAWITAKIYDYNHNEVMVMWGLSQAQAASTLAATLVGVELGIFDIAVFNGAVLMILFTCVTSPILTKRFGERINANKEINPDPAPKQGLFSRILVPLANPDSQENLLRLASILATTNKGTLLPLKITRTSDKQASTAKNIKQIMDTVSALQLAEVEVQPIYRIDYAVSKGILHSATEHNASMMILGWSGDGNVFNTVFGKIMDEVVWESDIPVFVSKITSSILVKKEVLLIITENSIPENVIADTLKMAQVIAQTINVPLVLKAHKTYEDAIAPITAKWERKPTILPCIHQDAVHLSDGINPNALVLIATSGSRTRFRSLFGNLPQELSDRTGASLVVVHYPKT